MNDNKRPKLLPDTEINDIYARPVFNKKERELYFDLSKEEMAALEQFTNKQTRLYFILQLGYFKAKQQFFRFNFEEVSSDVMYITQTHFGEVMPLHGSISRESIKRQKSMILDLLNYHAWSMEFRNKAEQHLQSLLKYYPQGHNAMRQLLIYFEQHETVIPSYRIFQDMFSSAFAVESQRLAGIVATIPITFQDRLNAFNRNNNGMTDLNLVRLEPKDFQCMAMREEAEKAQRIVDLYEFAVTFIPRLELARNAICYYAEITEDYPAARLRKLKQPQQWLYTLCFVYQRYQQIMDNLISGFLYRVRLIQDAGTEAAERAFIQYQARLSLNFPGAAKFIAWFPNRNKDLSYEAINKIAYDMLPESEFSSFSKFLEGLDFDKKAAKWAFYAEQSRSLSLYLRPILMAVEFSYFKRDSHLMEMINLLRNHYADGKSPKQFKLSDDMGFTIPKNMLPYLKTHPDDQYVDPHLFEFFVYERMHYQIEKGRLFCNHSTLYCDLGRDLVPESLVNRIDEIAQKFGYKKLPIYCDERLDDALETLHRAWEITRGNLQQGENIGIQLEEDSNGNTDWRLLYDASDELEARPIKELPKIEISDLLMFIGHRANIWRGFTHRKGRYIKRQHPEPTVTTATLLSQAFGIGEQHMSEMSDLSYHLLRYTREDFIRVETMCYVNDLVCSYTSGLPIYHGWNLLDDKLLADADGQKFSALGTIQSRYSKKYLGKGRGISLYTLTANFVAVNAKNIGLNEYEGHSLFDMVFNHKTDVSIHAVTGDNHSINKTNYLALDAIDIDYIPGIKNIKEAARHLCSVDSPENYTGIITPKAQIKPERIRSQKKMLLRILLSLILQENTQTNIIRKLNTCDRYAALRAALFEYDKIFKSIHVLNLVNNMKLRKAIRTARNRTESYHQLQQSIRKVYNGTFRGRKVVDNRISAHGARLIANCIIAYNATMLNKIYEKKIKNHEDPEVIRQFLRISPIAWAYLLFTGQYNFKNTHGNIDINEMTRLLESKIKDKLA